MMTYLHLDHLLQPKDRHTTIAGQSAPSLRWTPNGELMGA